MMAFCWPILALKETGDYHHGREYAGKYEEYFQEDQWCELSAGTK